MLFKTQQKRAEEYLKHPGVTTILKPKVKVMKRESSWLWVDY